METENAMAVAEKTSEDTIRIEETIAVTNMYTEVVKIKELLYTLEVNLEGFDIEARLDRLLRKAG